MSKKIIPLEDLSFFQTGGLFAQQSAATRTSGASHFLSLVTSTMDTLPFWLIRTLIASALNPDQSNKLERFSNSSNSSAISSRSNSLSSTPRRNSVSSLDASLQQPHVVLVSCVDRKSLYYTSLQRQHIFLAREKRFSYVDVSKILSFDSEGSKSGPDMIKQILDLIKNSIPKPQQETANAIVIFDSPDFLIPFLQDPTPASSTSYLDSIPVTTQLLNMFLQIQKMATNVYAFVSADDSLFSSPATPSLLERNISVITGGINGTSITAQTPGGAPGAGISGSGVGFSIGASTGNPGNIYETKQTAFVLGLAHRATALISIRPLMTGRADDVTGTLTVSRGPKSSSDTQVLTDSYQYHVSGDNVKVFYK